MQPDASAAVGGNRHKQVSLQAVREYNRRLQRHMRLISVQTSTDIRAAINLLQVYSISQLPVLDGDHAVGSLNERALLARLTAADLCLWRPVLAFMQAPLPALEETAHVEAALALLCSNTSGVIVTRAGVPVGILTAADLIAFKVYGGQVDYVI